MRTPPPPFILFLVIPLPAIQIVVHYPPLPAGMYYAWLLSPANHHWLQVTPQGPCCHRHSCSATLPLAPTCHITFLPIPLPAIHSRWNKLITGEHHPPYPQHLLMTQSYRIVCLFRQAAHQLRRAPVTSTHYTSAMPYATIPSHISHHHFPCPIWCHHSSTHRSMPFDEKTVMDPCSFLWTSMQVWMEMPIPSWHCPISMAILPHTCSCFYVEIKANLEEVWDLLGYFVADSLYLFLYYISIFSKIYIFFHFLFSK